jgi:hypothetical protein
MRYITAFALQIDSITDKGGKGTLTIEEDSLTFNDYGDASNTGWTTPTKYPVRFQREPKTSAGVGRVLYDVIFADGRLPGRLWLAWSDDPGVIPRLVVRSEKAEGRDGPDRVLNLYHPTIRPDALGNNDQPDHFHFETLAVEPTSTLNRADARPRLKRIALRGSLKGPAYVDLDPNHLMLSPAGDVQGTTCLGWKPIEVKFKPLGPDPAKKGRRAFALVPQVGARSYILVLGAKELDPHRLVIKETGKVAQVLPLTDSHRTYHLRNQPELLKVPAEERKAIEQLRTICGYKFRVFFENKHVSAVMLLDGDISKLDPILKPLVHLKELDFNKAKLPATGLSCLKGMKELVALSFYYCEINDDGLASVKDTTTLQRLLFFGSQGPTARGLAHFEKLTNLTMFQIRREDEPKDGPILDEGLKYLKGMTRLTSLNLHGQRITNEGLAHLGALTSLREMYLSADLVTEAGLKHLEGLRDLADITFYRSSIAPEVWKTFRAKFPKMKRP